jgi:hypothetical protein
VSGTPQVQTLNTEGFICFSPEEKGNIPMTTTEDIKENIEKSMNSEDRPIGDVEPSAPFAMVGLSYMIILILTIAVLATLWVFFG